jgi:hypothetical protein
MAEWQLHSVHPQTLFSPQRRTTAGMQELEQRMEQLPEERRENIQRKQSNIKRSLRLCGAIIF